jgi:uncharacterized protein (TIGR03382 family)
MPKPFAAGNTALGGGPKALSRSLPALIETDIPELDLEAGTVDVSPTSNGEMRQPPSNPTSSSCSAGPGTTVSLGWIALGMVAMGLARRRTVH